MKATPIKWRMVTTPMSSWNYRLSMEYYEKQFPLFLGSRYDGIREEVKIDSIDLDLRTTSKEEVPDDIVMKHFSCLKDHFQLIANIGGRWMKSIEKHKGERLGLCTISIARGYPKSGLFEQTWWDVPNNVKLVSKELKVGNFVKMKCAIHLPFISLPPCKNDLDIAMAFDYDDFLPNP